MATIYKRRNKYCVVYWYEDENGQKHQKWESYNSNMDAKRRKNEIEYQQDTNTFIVPQAKTVSDLLDDYVALYGVSKWAMSTYDHSLGLINNYIKPIIGNMQLSDVTTRVIEKYYQNLKKVNLLRPELTSQKANM